MEAPFKIIIDVYADYINPYEEPQSSDEENDEETPPKLTKSYKTEHCVICMEKEANILFYDCMHICICLGCEENSHLNQCP